MKYCGVELVSRREIVSDGKNMMELTEPYIR